MNRDDLLVGYIARTCPFWGCVEGAGCIIDHYIDVGSDEPICRKCYAKAVRDAEEVRE